MPLHQASGFGLALLSMVLYGLYMAPRRVSGVSHESYTLWMAFGILVGSLVIGFVDGGVPRVSGVQYAIIVASGVVWGTGTLGYTRAVQLIGLSRSTPVKNLSAVFGVLLGVVAFHEFSFRSPVSMLLVFAGTVAVVVSASLLGFAEGADDIPSESPTRHLSAGLLYSLWAAIAYSLYTLPMKVMYKQGVTPTEFLMCMGQGCYIGMVAPVLLSRRERVGAKACWRDRWLAQLSGVMWAVGSLCANVAVKTIGVAVTWPLTKTTLVAALYGAFVLKELELTRNRGRFTAGVVLSVVGVIALAVALAGRA